VYDVLRGRPEVDIVPRRAADVLAELADQLHHRDAVVGEPRPDEGEIRPEARRPLDDGLAGRGRDHAEAGLDRRQRRLDGQHLRDVARLREDRRDLVVPEHRAQHGRLARRFRG
jgi:hypothetical protein